MPLIFQSVDEYIASQPEAARGVLQRVRGAIRKAVPAAEETISYNMPTYKLHGEAMLYFAGWKRHYSLYPATARVLAAFQDELAAFEIAKSTIRFPLSEPVPAKLIGLIAKFRANEVAERVKPKAAAAEEALTPRNAAQPRKRSLHAARFYLPFSPLAKIGLSMVPPIWNGNVSLPSLSVPPASRANKFVRNP